MSQEINPVIKECAEELDAVLKKHGCTITTYSYIREGRVMADTVIKIVEAPEEKEDAVTLPEPKVEEEE